MFFTLFGYWVRGLGGGGVSQGIGTPPAYAVFHPGQLQNRSFRNFFVDIVITFNDHPRYVKHVLGRICVFHLIWVLGAGLEVRGLGGGESPKGLVHNLLMQFFTLGSSKIEVSETYFFDTVIT